MGNPDSPWRSAITSAVRAVHKEEGEGGKNLRATTISEGMREVLRLAELRHDR